MDINKLIIENLSLQKQVAGLLAENEKLKRKVNELEELPANQFTLDQFIKNYLTNRFTIETMPKVGGIYAYYNRKESLLYVGQAKDLKRRLTQHFKAGKIKVKGHDSEFKNEQDWEFYVLEYVNKNDKSRLDDREAYWIAMAKVATSDKRVIDKKEARNYAKNLASGKPVSDIDFTKTVKQKGGVTNRTRGNNVRM